MSKDAQAAKLPSISDYYSATQLRADRWSALRETVESLSRHGHTGRQGQKLIGEAEALLDALAPIERYWAFPGYCAFAHLRKMLDTRAIADLAFATRRVARALATGAYRRRSIPLTTTDSEMDKIKE